jgi:ERCC4-type nuclease
MSVSIRLDHRETSLNDYLSKQQLADGVRLVSSTPLSIGDVVLCDDKDDVLVIIERKTLTDLSASIKDGRYREQAHRLGCLDIPRHRVMYIIEGDWRTYQPGAFGLGMGALQSAMASLWFCDGMSLFRTNDVEETGEWILTLARKLTQQQDQPSQSPQYSTVCKMTKKAQVTLENIDTIMLAQIPDVSPSAAQAVVRIHPTIRKLIEVLQTNPVALDGVSTVSRSGKHRKISKKAIKNIYKFLKC